MHKTLIILFILMFSTLTLANEQIELTSGYTFKGNIKEIENKIIKMGEGRLIGLNIVNRINTDNIIIVNKFKDVYPNVKIINIEDTYTIDIESLNIIFSIKDNRFWDEFSIQFNYINNSFYKYEIINYIKPKYFNSLFMQFIFSSDQRFENIGFGFGSGKRLKMKNSYINASINYQYNHSAAIPNIDSNIYVSIVYSHSIFSNFIIPQIGYKYTIDNFKYFSVQNKDNLFFGLGVFFHSSPRSSW